MKEVSVGIKLSVKSMVPPEPGSLEFICTPAPLCLQTVQMACKCPLLVDRLDFQIIGRMKAQLHSVWAPVALSPSCPCSSHTHSVLFTNLCFYSELVILFFCFIFRLLTEDGALCFNSFRMQCHFFFKNNSNTMCFSYLCAFFFICSVTVLYMESAACVYSTNIVCISLLSPWQCS